MKTERKNLIVSLAGIIMLAKNKIKRIMLLEIKEINNV